MNLNYTQPKGMQYFTILLTPAVMFPFFRINIFVAAVSSKHKAADVMIIFIFLMVAGFVRKNEIIS